MLVQTSVFARMTARARRAVAGSAAAWLAAALPANAQNASVYVANSANSRVLQVQFSPVSTSVAIDGSNLLTQVRDIAIRDDGLSGSGLIACDRNGGRIVFFPNASGPGGVVFAASTASGPERPDGMCLDLAGNLFVMNSGQGSSAGVGQAWVMLRDRGCPNPGRPECRPGGYRAPLGLIDPEVRIATQFGGIPALLETDLLPEAIVAPSSAGAVHAGDLLVLTNPGALVRYQAAQVSAFLLALGAWQTPAPLTPDTIIHPAGASVPSDQQFPAGAEPSGVALASSGDLLIPLSDSRILIYGPDGRRRSNDFASGGGQDEFKIAVGLQDGRQRAFVTHRQRGELWRYSFATDGTGILDSVVGGLQFPVGVDASNSRTVAAIPGTNVTVAPTTVMSSRIERVVQGGLLTSRVSTFPDPRESEVSIPPNLPLHRSLFLNELRADFPPVEIPAWVRTFRLGDPNTGTPSFIVVEADSSVVVSGLLDHLAVEGPILGYEPNCADPDITRQPFMFWSPDANDPPIVEGARFIDVTTGCDSIRAMTRDVSYFLAGVRITEPMRDLVGQKLSGLRLVIGGSACISAQVQRKLLQALDRADRDWSRGRYADLSADLQSIEDQVLASPQAFSTCTLNTAGEIRARVRSALFAVTKLP